jgi:hypothetical protein
MLIRDFSITKTDSIEYCGKYHKRFILNSQPPETLIEGIGFSNGLLGFQNDPSIGESYYELYCYTEWNNLQCPDCELLLNPQEYIPMLGNSNQWYILRTFEGRYTYIFTTQGDTLINNKSYKILGRQGVYYIPGFIREDTLERKVYMMPNSIKDTFEIVYFDFSLNENDSIFIYSINYDSLGYFRVDSVRYISTLGGLRKAIYLNDPRIVYDIPAPVWVEGIGTLGSIEYRESPSESYNAGELSCYFKDGVKIYQSEFSKSLDTCIIEWSGVEDFELLSDITSVR